MIKYLANIKTSIITVDDINTVVTLSRITDDKDKTSYSVFRKIGGLSNLTDENLKRILASSIISLEIAMKITPVDNAKNITDAARIIAIVYVNKENQNISVKLYKSESLKEAEKAFIDEHKDIAESDVVVFSVGYIAADSDVSDLLAKEYLFKIKPIPSGNLMIREGVTLFNEFNSKLYEVELYES